MNIEPASPPLIAHVIYRLDVGGLENGLVNIINRMPAERYRHLIISLTEVTDFRRRIQRPDVGILALHKRPGHDWPMYWRLLQLFRQHRPAIVHSRNLAALEAQLPALLAGVPCRLHGEHGWDVQDLDGRRYRWLKRALRPLVSHYIALSQELESYLHDVIGVRKTRLSRILNGVDTERFHPPGSARPDVLPAGFRTAESLVIGTVGRMEAVKDQVTLARAFIELAAQRPDLRRRLRLVMVGDGSRKPQLEGLLREAGLLEQAWLPGARDDVPELMRALDVFVLPSLAEGISNTIMEAMASGLPVVATAVGGNAELVEDGSSGYLVPAADPVAMAEALAAYAEDPARREAHGRAARERAVRDFSLERMVAEYLAVYDGCLQGRAN
ncbi:TIGR03088 family PEP-CTERM/XrtA system glycosyltransferase [Thiohalobacter sp. IOR34]|uniref:TIGR03088 family PEP-CTERM/XrtA system glycosyltransferase n=1 Tax=Thiohalobacter sp. IOR34 TaxID=3057176 RepID=UPI0025AF5424|nr:TIGR03088 family PEP-CTERM/XrtA system glycosyltransferase [Thiohalobacter sp. IOR34]WJW74457.1 TIGR03088 family PEP-CTERM/XrtA system glycosyltransferase [Thiohalobacter sp. IOR34]